MLNRLCLVLLSTAISPSAALPSCPTDIVVMRNWLHILPGTALAIFCSVVSCNTEPTAVSCAFFGLHHFALRLHCFVALLLHCGKSFFYFFF